MRVLRWPGNFVHVLFLLLVLLLCGLVYAIGRLGTLLLFWGAERRARAVSTLRGWVLRQGMTTLGATFIKMGQVMSTRPDLFSPGVISQLRRLQDRLPAFAFWRARRIIEKDLGRPLNEVFTDFGHEPVAAASVAQVHKAKLRETGAEVAVKVLRPSVRRQVERDAAILLGGARVLNLSKNLRLSDPVGHLRHFVQAIIDQTDLRIEAKNYTQFRKNFADIEVINFPVVYHDLCTERVLTMEFCYGVKIDELPPGSHPEMAEATRQAIFKMCFDDGLVHADLHPGNMVVRDGKELVIFDVGLAKQMHEDVLIQFIDMSKCLAMGTSDDLVNHLRRFHTYMDGVDWEGLRADVDAFAETFRGQNVQELEYSELLGEMFALGRKYHVRPVTDMTLVFVALVTAQGIGKMLDPDNNTFDEVAKYLIPILMRRNETIPDSEQAEAARGANEPLDNVIALE